MKTVVITGSSRGLGLEMAKEFRKNGHHVVINGVNPKRLADAKETLNDAMMLGLNMYGTSKRAVTHFTQALAKESEEKNTGVLVGRQSPGIMITDFTVNALGGKEQIELPEKTKKVYNILGDYPNVVAQFLVKRMLENQKNNAHIEWLTSRKAAWRFMTAGFNKRDFFKK